MAGKEEGFLDVGGLDFGLQVLEGAYGFARRVTGRDQAPVADFVGFALMLARIAEHRRQGEEVAHQRHSQHADHQGKRRRTLDVFGLLQRVAMGEVRALVRLHGGELGFVLEAGDQPGVHVDAAIGQGKRVEVPPEEMKSDSSTIKAASAPVCSCRKARPGPTV